MTKCPRTESCRGVLSFASPTLADNSCSGPRFFGFCRAGFFAASQVVAPLEVAEARGGKNSFRGDYWRPFCRRAPRASRSAAGTSRFAERTVWGFVLSANVRHDGPRWFEREVSRQGAQAQSDRRLRADG